MAEAFNGITAGLKSTSLLNFVILFKYYHEKKYNESLTLKTFFLPYKISRIWELPRSLPPGSPPRLCPGPTGGHKAAPRLAHPRTSNPGSAPEMTFSLSIMKCRYIENKNYSIKISWLLRIMIILVTRIPASIEPFY